VDAAVPSLALAPKCSIGVEGAAALVEQCRPHRSSCSCWRLMVLALCVVVGALAVAGIEVGPCVGMQPPRWSMA